MPIDRREFLRLGVGTGVTLSLSPGVLPHWLHAQGVPQPPGRTLVVLELTGGNDALNMVVPYGDDVYHRLRPRLRLAEKEIHRIDEYHGFHPNMHGLHDLFQKGWVNIVQGVGYPNPDRSHFRSLDIWHSAQPQLQQPAIGWIGRAADGSQTPFALRIGSHDLPLALRSRSAVIPT